jgi:DNA-binding Lrp family transcriptional regulator
MYYMTAIDFLDLRLVDELRSDPRIGVLEISRRLGVARATVQARLDKLIRAGVLDLSPTLHPGAFGFPVMALVSVQLQQVFSGEAADRALARIPEVIEIHSSTGDADLIVKVVARSNRDLQRVLGEMLNVEQVIRTSSSIALLTHLETTAYPLFASVVDDPAR